MPVAEAGQLCLRPRKKKKQETGRTADHARPQDALLSLIAELDTPPAPYDVTLQRVLVIARNAAAVPGRVSAGTHGRRERAIPTAPRLRKK